MSQEPSDVPNIDNDAASGREMPLYAAQRVNHLDQASGTTSAVDYSRQSPSHTQSHYETVVRRQRIRSGSNPLKIPHRLLYPSVRRHPYLAIQDESTPTTPSLDEPQDGPELPQSRLDVHAAPSRTFYDWEFSGWGTMTFETITNQEIDRVNATRELRRRLEGEATLGTWLGSGVAGVAVAGSPLYAFPALVSVAGVYSPVSLLIATLLLLLWRPIIVELGQVIPRDGANYAFILNSAGKTAALVAAVLTIMDDVATSVVSAGTAASYIAAEVDREGAALWLTLALLVGFTAFGLAGIKGSAEVMSMTLSLHLLTIAMVVLASIIAWARTGNQVIAANWTESAQGTAASIAKRIFLGVCVAFLGVTGIESAPDSRSAIQDAAYPVVIRNLSWLAIMINAPLMLVTFAVLPMDQILNNQSVVRSVAQYAAGDWLRIWTSIDSVLILCSTILTGVVSSNALVTRLAGDNILPHVFANRVPKTGAPYVASALFGVVAVVIYASSGFSLSTIFAIVFLAVMSIFPVACLLLSYHRPRLPRRVRSPFGLSVVVLSLSLVLIVGNVVISPIIIAYLVAYTAVLTSVMWCIYKRSKLFQILFWAVEQSSWTASCKTFKIRIARWIKKTRTGPIVLFVESDEIHRLHDMLVYVKQNEETDLVKVVHCFKAPDEIPSELEANCKILDEALPSITLDLVFIQAEFSPSVVHALGPVSRFSLREFGNSRVVAS
ncbi:hypothetical protein OIV83_003346 [Microbotryomycetes sp. JL201]|nr:hypothetical protein OIV83_003346 [Microbotryomycetes sp. JL201]